MVPVVPNCEVFGTGEYECLGDHARCHVVEICFNPLTSFINAAHQFPNWLAKQLYLGVLHAPVTSPTYGTRRKWWLPWIPQASNLCSSSSSSWYPPVTLFLFFFFKYCSAGSSFSHSKFFSSFFLFITFLPGKVNHLNSVHVYISPSSSWMCCMDVSPCQI